MARSRRHLPNAPIVEAVIDFRVLPQEQATFEMFGGLTSLIGDPYSQKSTMQSVQARFGLENGQWVNSLPTPATIGWIYQTSTEIAQFRVDGFTFNKIAPYTTWEQVFGEAHRLWKIYKDVARPKQISRIAVRYINRMRFIAPTSLAEYIESPPTVPAPISKVVREFLSRIVIDDQERRASAVITQALEPRIDQDQVTLLLDIDAFRESNVPQNDSELPMAFEQLRKLKNEIFFASITEKTAEMYE